MSAKYGSLSRSLSTSPKATAAPKVVGTPQNVKTPGTVKNNAGGYVYKVSQWDMLDRFLILGAEGNSYYTTEKKMVIDNAKNTLACIKADGVRVVNRIVEISKAGRAPKNSSALFALALCTAHGTTETKQAAMKALPSVARIGTHLFQFAHYVDGLRGWGSSLRKGIANWYESMEPSDLALQVIKYPQRTAEEGNPKSAWSHDDLLRKARGATGKTTNKARAAIYRYVTKDGELPSRVPTDLKILEGTQKIKGCTKAHEAANLITQYGLPHEVVPKELANDPIVNSALLPHMPITATLNMLGRLTSYGVLKPLSPELKMVVDRLTNPEAIRKGRIHPINVLKALKTYAQGHGMKGNLKWTPIPQITDALDRMLYLSFAAVQPSGKNILIALDVSGSMGTGKVSGMDYLSAREAAAVMAMATAKVEKNYHIVAFTSGGYRNSRCTSKWGATYPAGISPIDISPSMRLDKVCEKLASYPMGGTNCALPMLYALENKMNVDVFVVYTDNETWDGGCKASEALQEYRRAINPQAKLVVCGTEASPFTIADPNDPGSLDLVGFDSAAPAIISDFVRTPIF
jgi:60 kDa SS-A/Ro ribonucleoprotein